MLYANGVRQEQDIFVRLVDSATKQVSNPFQNIAILAKKPRFSMILVGPSDRTSLRYYKVVLLLRVLEYIFKTFCKVKGWWKCYCKLFHRLLIIEPKNLLIELKLLKRIYIDFKQLFDVPIKKYFVSNHSSNVKIDFLA